tara:strand:+ start:2019 stop:2696 length:678 start_codon:yes stop_codon:yes gene_type:complete
MIERSKVGITSPGQFIYAMRDSEDNVVYVRKEQKYIKEYRDTKTVIYRLLRTKERIIKLKENDLVAVYKKTGKARKRDDYPVKTFPTSANLAGKKFINRVFAQNKISDSKEIIEVVAATNSTSFKFVEIKWQILGNLEQSKTFNRQQLVAAESVISGITDILPLDQLHISKFLALASMRPEYQGSIQPEETTEATETTEENTQQTQPTGPPPGVVTGGAGGGGGY